MDVKTIVTLVIAGVAFIVASSMLLEQTIRPKLYVSCLMSDYKTLINHPIVFSWIFSTLIYISAWIGLFTLIWIAT